jgi:hypothetical protein
MCPIRLQCLARLATFTYAHHFHIPLDSPSNKEERKKDSLDLCDSYIVPHHGMYRHLFPSTWFMCHLFGNNQFDELKLQKY